MSKEMQVTPASDWAARTKLVELPSGKVAELKERMSAMSLLRHADQRVLDALDKLRENEKLEDAEAALKLQEIIVTELFVTPKVVVGEPNSDDEISINDVPDEDLTFIVSDYAFGGGRELDQFRDDGTGEGSSDNSEDMELSTESDSGDTDGDA